MPGRLSADEIAELEHRLAHTFTHKSLLRRALMHAGPTGEPQADNERLEFLGDRVLGLVVAEDLYRRFPDVPEGQLARRFNALVSKSACAGVAEEMGLPELVARRGNDAAITQRVLADICEALVAAVYLDAGIEAARSVVLTHWQAGLETAELTRRDPKSQLQEWALGKALPVPDYTVVSREGPDHAPLFTIAVRVDGHDAVQGSGPSKREAEQAAAEAFLDKHGIART